MKTQREVIDAFENMFVNHLALAVGESSAISSIISGEWERSVRS